MGANVVTDQVFRSVNELFTHSIGEGENAHLRTVSRGESDALASTLAERNKRIINIAGESAMEDFVARAIDDADFTTGAGRIAPDLNAKFHVLLRGEKAGGPGDAFWSAINVKKMGKINDSVPKAMWMEPSTDADDGSIVTYDQKPKVGLPTQLAASMLKSSYGLRYTADYANIEFGQFKNIVADGALGQFKQDIRHLAWRGNKTTYSGSTTKVGKLLKVLNGWAQQARGKHRLNAAGAEPSLPMFEAAFRRLPSYAQQAEDLAWHTHPAVAAIFRQSLGTEIGAVADAAKRGDLLNPLGFQFRNSLHVPFTDAITVGVPNSGYTVSANRGPFLVTSTASKILLRLDTTNNTSGVATTITVDAYASIVVPRGLTQDYVWTHELANLINDAFEADAVNYGATYANVARDDGEGHLMVVSPRTGTSSVIDVKADANAMYTVLGFTAGTAGTNTGAASGGTVPNGSMIVLCPSSSFTLGVLEPTMPEGTRIDSRYNQDYGQVQTVIRSGVDAKFNDEDSVACIYNVLAFKSL